VASAAFQAVDLAEPDGRPAEGLVPVGEVSARAQLSVAERAAVLDAANFSDDGACLIDYVFFRRFADGRSSQAAAYVVDNTDDHLDSDTLASLHHQLWMHGNAAILYVAWETRVDVLSCRRGPDFWNEHSEGLQYNPAATIGVAASIDMALQDRKRFSVYRLADGTFWDEPANAFLVDNDKAAHKTLIEAIVETDEELHGDSHPEQRRLLLLTVLLKYLEDRGVFPEQGWFGRFQKGAKSFFDVLYFAEPQNVHRLLKFLEERFNGDIFRAPNGRNWNLTKASLKRFAALVEGKTLNRQRYLWEQYSFAHLPVEVISHLYQRFVQDGRGTVYTPSIVVNLLLDRVMSYESLTGDERVLDPSCGSGVFLVGAFRRLVNVWRAGHAWRRPNVPTLKRILRRSIFGVELEEGAIDLAAFSLALAICDSLQPEVIWADLRLDALRDRNLFQADFFDAIGDSDKSSATKGEFDIVVGNPPFESDLTESATELLEVEEDEAPPDNQAAYLFLAKAASRLSESGRICLIQPSGLLYNRNVLEYRRKLFEQYVVDTVFDFTSVRGLYDGADPKSVAILLVNETPEDSHFVKHLTFRRTAATKERMYFELDHYDRHLVPQIAAASDPFVWRANLLGGGRLVELAKRLREIRTLETYLEERRQDGWDYGEGYIAAIHGKREPAPWLTGQRFLPTQAFTSSGIDEERISKVSDKEFRSAYTLDRYSPPLVLIKKLQSLPVELWTNGVLAYKHRIIGIHAPTKDRAELVELYERLKKWRRLYECVFLLQGTEGLIGLATTVRKQDVDMLPYPELDEEFELTFWERALCDDAVDYMSEYIRLGQSSELLQLKVDDETLAAYAELYQRMLGSVYSNLKSHDPFWLNGLVCQPFCFGQLADLKWLDSGESHSYLEKLVYADHQESLRTVRVVRFYDGNVIFLVKPDRKRYWTRSIAIRDADETLADLREQGW